MQHKANVGILNEDNFVQIGVIDMAVTQETLMKKMKEALTQAEQRMHTDEFAVSIGKLHVLCELVLEDTDGQDRPKHRSVTSEQHAMVESSQRSSPTQFAVGHAKDDSIFDF